MAIIINDFQRDEWAGMKSKMAEWAVLWAGDPTGLAEFYQQKAYTPTSAGRFWSKQIANERQNMLHVPIAADIASVNADLLFGEPPEYTIPAAHTKAPPDKAIATEDRLNEIALSGDVRTALLEAGETCSAMGGAYPKIDFDKDKMDVPILNIVQPDCAFPIFDFRRILVGVSFLKELKSDSSDKIWRLEEKREKGKVSNILWLGTTQSLGHSMNLKAHDATKMLKDVQMTGIDDLLVRYVPNKRPNKLFRGSPLGISDFAGVEGLMDGLDEVYTNIVDEVRRGRGRIIIPQSWMKKDPVTGKMFFDDDQTVFQGANMGQPGKDGNQGIHLSQFKIRADEHLTIMMEFLNRIITSAGFSPQSFGLNIQGSAESGSALRIRERKSLKTQQKKAMYFQQPLQDILQLMLKVDQVHFNNNDIDPELQVRVKFADSIQESYADVAASVVAVNQAQAASRPTLVKILNPDLSPDEVKKEVDLIYEEQGFGVDVVDEPFIEGGGGDDDKNTDTGDGDE